MNVYLRLSFRTISSTLPPKGDAKAYQEVDEALRVEEEILMGEGLMGFLIGDVDDA